MSGERRIRVLVLGRDGQVGRELMRTVPPADLSVTGLGRDALDITRPDAIASAIGSAQCGFVVNAAAYTQVDRAESEREQAFAVNRDGAAYIAEACRSRGVPLLHLSTDYVFDGTKAAAYAESDPVRPLGVYGESKEAGERAIRDRLDRHLILRTAWVFSPFRHNFVKTMLRLGREREEIGVVDDQTGCPTAAADIARTILTVAERAVGDGFDRWGTYHFCNAGLTTWHGFARAIFAAAAARGAPTPRLRAIETSDYPTPARRPANSVLDCGRIAAAFGITPRLWRAALDECLDELLEPDGRDKRE
jgi:dTDP-4-dehydrorhamnose reductase